jgi:hypothetical protein
MIHQHRATVMDATKSPQRQRQREEAEIAFILWLLYRILCLFCILREELKWILRCFATVADKMKP